MAGRHGWFARAHPVAGFGCFSMLSNESAPGILLHALVGYDATPTGLQLVFYVGAIALIAVATRLMKAWQTKKLFFAV